MKKICKALLSFLVISTTSFSLIAVASVIILVLSLFFGSAFSALAWLFFIAMVLLPGALIALLGIILGWISVLFGKMVLLLIAVILIALGVGVCFLAFLPWGAIAGFAIVVLLGILCCKKQRNHNDISE